MSSSCDRGLVSDQWKTFEEGISQMDITEDQTDEIQALSFVYPELRVRMKNGSVELQTSNIYVEKHHCNITITIELTRGYPEQLPNLKLRSASIADSVLNGVCRDVMSQCVPGEPVAHQLLVDCEMIVDGLEPGVVADYFVICPPCNITAAKNGLPKMPQPTNYLYDRCLTCNNEEVIGLPSVKPNREHVMCAYCFCEGTPIVLLPCGDSICVECFQNWATVDIGARRLKEDPETGCWSIACQSHPNKVLCDVNMLKLIPPRIFRMYTRFSFLAGLEGKDGMVCPLPNCNNYPFFTGSCCSLVHCPYCFHWFCKTCKTPPRECECDTLIRDSERFPSSPWERKQVIEHQVSMTPDRETGTIPIRVLHHMGNTDMYINPKWSAVDLMQILALEIFHEVYHFQAAITPWEYSNEVPRWTIPLQHLVVFRNGKALEPSESLSEVPPASLLYAVVSYPRTVKYKEFLDEEVDLWQFRRNLRNEDTVSEEKRKKNRTDFKGKKCPHCQIEVVHYYNHGCHHIGFAGEGCCDKHWCYSCNGPHPCNNGCTAYCDVQNKCGCPLCPDCKPGNPCPSCQGCPQCTHESVDLNIFDVFA